jgi:hypothetical protein
MFDKDLGEQSWLGVVGRYREAKNLEILKQGYQED